MGLTRGVGDADALDRLAARALARAGEGQGKDEQAREQGEAPHD